MGRLDNKVAVITGAASGIGRGTAIRFAVEGASVVIADLNEEGGAASVRECRENGGTAIFQKTDVAAEGDIKALVARAVQEFGKLDIIYNNAGLVGATGSIEATSVEDWDRTFAVLTRGFPWDETCPPRDAEKRRWLDNLNRLGRGALRRVRNACLQRSEGRGREYHSLGRARSCETQDPGQLHLPGRNQHSDLQHRIFRSGPD